MVTSGKERWYDADKLWSKLYVPNTLGGKIHAAMLHRHFRAKLEGRGKMVTSSAPQ